MPSRCASPRRPPSSSGPACDPALRHLANSAATLTNPSAHFDLVRPGLAVYGLSPVPDLGDPAHFGLREAMRVTARLTLVKRARAGQGVSYGHEYVTDRDTVLGLVPMGYADGIPQVGRRARPGAGRRAAAAGRRPGLHGPVRVDLGPGFAGAAGDEVVVLGRDAPTASPRRRTGREAAGTINYEIVTRIGAAAAAGAARGAGLMALGTPARRRRQRRR